MKRKYRLNRIGKCYVSSTSHAYLKILVDTYSKNRFQGTLILNVQSDGAFQHATARSFEESFFNPPQYLVSEVKEALKTHEFSFYEYDKHEEIRTENLRYTNKELIVSRFLDYANSEH